ncbi:MAG: glycosyltransferase [Patescibacteria group bacterium]
MKDVAVVIVNYNGFRFLDKLFYSLENQSLKMFKDFDVYFSDNGSIDDSVSFVEIFYSKTIIYKNKKNLGFAEGNNIVLKNIYKKYKYIVLLNNDVYVERNWLKELLETTKRHENVGIAGSKLLFYYPFLDIQLKSNKNYIDNKNRKISFKINYIQINNNKYNKIVYKEGFYDPENEKGEIFIPSKNRSSVFLPFKKSSSYKLYMSLSGLEKSKKQTVKVLIGEDLIGEVELGDTFKQYELKINKNIVDKNKFFLINNASSSYNKNGYGKDIGFKEKDTFKYNKEKKAISVCGASMLINTEVFKDIGFLDRNFFMYYEDTDFCWRASNTKKWNIYYSPKSVVRHIHTGSSTEWSPFFTFYVKRNRLLMLLKNSSLAVFRKNLNLSLKESRNIIFSKEPMSKKILEIKIIISLFSNLPKMYIKRIFK